MEKGKRRNSPIRGDTFLGTRCICSVCLIETGFQKGENRGICIDEVYFQQKKKGESRR
jgi:hypothetical protein